jgi:hypothetical protein
LCRYFIATGEKIHQPEEKNWTKTKLYCLIDEEIGIKNVSKFSEGLGVKRQVVEKALKNSRVESIVATDNNAVRSALVKNIQRDIAELQNVEV